MNPYQKGRIQKLWQQNFISTKPNVSLFGIQKNYPDSISEHHPRFRLVRDLFFERSSAPVFFDEHGQGASGTQKLSDAIRFSQKTHLLGR
jgi:hypothetical protein